MSKTYKDRPARFNPMAAALRQGQYQPQTVRVKRRDDDDFDMDAEIAEYESQKGYPGYDRRRPGRD